MAEEMRFHLQQRAADNIDDGMPPDEARFAARRKFGNVGVIQERARDQRGWLWLEQFFQDIRFAARGLSKARAFTLTAGLTLALGIGANTAIFPLVHAVILRPLPFPDPQRLMFVWNNNARDNIPDDLASWPTFEDWRAQNRTFAQMSGYLPGNADLTGDGEPEQVPSCSVGDAFFETLGISPLLGRPFSAEEQIEGKDGVAIISHGLWQRRFGGDRSVVGKVIQTNGRLRTVIGVMPPGFAFPAEVDLYLPIAPSAATRARRNLYWVSVIGRLNEGVTVAQAQADLDAITANIVRQFPRESGRAARVVGVHAWTVRNVRTALWVLLGAVGCVLLIACANLANLLLARGLARRREIAVRVALGAGRERIARQLLAESLLLAVGGGMVGLLLAQLVLDVIKTMSAASLPSLAVIAIDPAVLFVTAVVCLCCGIGFGLAPAWQASRTDPHEALKENARTHVASRSTRFTRATLVVAQTALAVVLLVGAGLLLRSFWKLSQACAGCGAIGVCVDATQRGFLVSILSAAARGDDLPQCGGGGAISGLALGAGRRRDRRCRRNGGHAGRDRKLLRDARRIRAAGTHLRTRRRQVGRRQSRGRDQPWSVAAPLWRRSEQRGPGAAVRHAAGHGHRRDAAGVRGLPGRRAPRRLVAATIGTAVWSA